MIQYQIQCAEDPTRTKYRSSSNFKLTPKMNYKQNPVTKIFFEK